MSDKSNGDSQISADERKVSEIYRNTATELPPADVDAAILALAKKTTNAKNKKTNKPWLFPSSIAASIMVVAIAYFNIYEQDYVPNGQEVAAFPPVPEASSTVQSEMPEVDTTAAVAFAESTTEPQKRAEEREAMAARMRTVQDREQMIAQKQATQERERMKAQKQATQERERMMAQKWAEQEQEAMMAKEQAVSAQEQSAKSEELAVVSQAQAPNENLSDGKERSVDALTETSNRFYEALLDIQRQLKKSHQEIMLAVAENNVETDIEDQNYAPQPYVLAFNNPKNKNESELLEEYKDLQIQFYQTLRLSKEQSSNFDLLEEYRLLLTDEQVKELFTDQ